MYKKIYTSVFHCAKCDKDISLDVFSQDVNSKLDEQGEDFALAANHQWHSQAEHTICGICGKNIKTDRGDILELIDGSTYKGSVHPLYLHRHHSFNPTDVLITVHQECMTVKIGDANATR